MSGAIEIRTAHDVAVQQPGCIAGYAAVFNSPSLDLGGFTESIEPGAFRRSIKSERVMALYEHDKQQVLGRSGAGTLRLLEDSRGLLFEIDLPPTQTGRDLEQLVLRGDVAGASFAFTTPEGGDQWTRRNDAPHRKLLDVDLHEITITSSPAYLDTSVAKRHFQALERPRLARVRRYLETV